jgi:hypothetical protein
MTDVTDDQAKRRGELQGHISDIVHKLHSRAYLDGDSPNMDYPNEAIDNLRRLFDTYLAAERRKAEKEWYYKGYHDGGLHHGSRTDLEKKRVEVEVLERIDKANKGNGISFWFKEVQDAGINNGWMTMKRYTEWRTGQLQQRKEQNGNNTQEE